MKIIDYSKWLETHELKNSIKTLELFLNLNGNKKLIK